MNIAAWLATHSLSFLHVFVRVTALFVMVPVFSMQEVPMRIKGILAAGIALVIYPIAAPYLPAGETMSPLFLLRLFDDMLIGLIIGIFVQVYYTAFLLSGEMYSIQLGFGIVSVLDPLSETSIPILGQLKSMLAATVFILVGGHLMVIEGMVYSFRAVPELTLAAAGPLAGAFTMTFKEMFLIAFQLAAPVIGTVFLIEVVMGILSKVAPQMNIMVVGFQIKIIVGLVVLAFLVPVIYTMAERVFDRSFTVLRLTLGAMG